MDEVVVTVLELLGLLLIAAGIGFLAGQWIGLPALIVSGAVVLAGAWIASRPEKPKKG